MDQASASLAVNVRNRAFQSAAAPPGCPDDDEWGGNWLIIFLPLTFLLCSALCVTTMLALKNARKLRDALVGNKIPHAPPPPPPPPPLAPTQSTLSSIQAENKSAELIALQRNYQALLKRSQQMEEENASLKDEIERLNGVIRQLQEQLERLRAENESLRNRGPEVRVVTRDGPSQIVEVPVQVEKRIEVPVEVPKVIEKPVEVTKLVVDEATELKLQYAEEDIEELKAEIERLREENASLRKPRTIKSPMPRAPPPIYVEGNDTPYYTEDPIVVREDPFVVHDRSYSEDPIFVDTEPLVTTKAAYVI